MLIEDLIRLDPKNYYAYYGLGRVYATQGDLPKAIESDETAIRLFPDFRECRQALAHLLLRQSRRDGRPRGIIKLKLGGLP